MRPGHRHIGRQTDHQAASRRAHRARGRRGLTDDEPAEGGRDVSDGEPAEGGRDLSDGEPAGADVSLAGAAAAEDGLPCSAGDDQAATTDIAATRQAGAGRSPPRWAARLPAVLLPRWSRRVARLWRAAHQRWAHGRETSDRAGHAFALVTVLPPLVLIAWLVPGAALLLAGRFLPVAVVLISVPAAAALIILALRDIPGRWPEPDARRGTEPPGHRGAGPRGRGLAAWWGLGGTVAVAAGFAAWQLMANSPQLIVSRDPGAYVQYAYWIAEHGSLPIPALPAAFGGAHPGLIFASFGFAGQGGTLAPQFTAGLPIVLSAGLWTHGVPGAAVVSPLLGALALLAVGGLTGRLAGPQWAPVGALLLALTVPEIYTSRSAFGEPLAQALLFGGLCLVVDSVSSRHSAVLAGLGGLALGLTVLAGGGYLMVLLPAIAFAGVLLARQRPQALPLCGGLLAGAGLGVACAFALGVRMAATTQPPLGVIGTAAAGMAGVTGAAVAVRLIPAARQRAARLLAARPLRWLPEAGAVAVAALVIGFAARPYVQTVRGAPNPYVAALQRLEHLPVDPGRLYAEKSLYWVVWYLGLPALLLGAIGLAVITRRCLRALLTWRDPAGAARVWALPLAIFGWSFLTVLWQPGTVPDQPWASRRLVPAVLPGLVVLAVWVAAWLTRRAREQGAGAATVPAAAACFVAALAIPPAAITFDVGPFRPVAPSVRVALAGLAFRHTSTGEFDAVRLMCGALPRHSSVLILDQGAARAYAQTVRGTCGAPAGVMAGAPAAEVGTVIGAIERAGRRPVLLASQPAELRPYQASPRQIIGLATQEDAHLLTQPPTSTWTVDYQLWMSTPGGTVGGY